MTIEDYCAIDIEQPSELVRGDIVKRQFPHLLHGIACANICHVLGRWNEEHGFGTPVALHGVITRRNPDSLRSIDVGYYSDSRIPQDGLDEYPTIGPEVAFEVRSHDETWLEITQKMNEFIEAGTKAFVVVEPFAKSVHVFEAGSRLQVCLDPGERFILAPLPSFSCQVSELFD